MESNQNPLGYSSQRRDIRNRLQLATLNDEDLPTNCLEYQGYLGHAFAQFARYQEALKANNDLEPDSEEERALDRAYAELVAVSALPRTPWQELRAEYLSGQQFRRLDLHDKTEDRDWKRRDYLGSAAYHFERAAQIAAQLEDFALVAELKDLVAGAYMGSKPYRGRFRPAFIASSQALGAWLKLPDRDQTSDLQNTFTLADRAALRAYIVGDDKDAIEALELAAFMLFLLRERPDFAAADNANNTLFLEWDWAAIYSSLGFYRHAFRQIVRTHRWMTEHARPINRIRLARVIAAIALDLAETGPVSEPSYQRLLRVAGSRIRAIYDLLPDCADEGGYALTLLAHAKWGALSGVEDDATCHAQIQEAYELAGKLNNVVLLAQVEIARGDEHARHRRFARAGACYLAAEQRMMTIGCAEIARVARRKLEQLPPPRRRKPPQTPPSHDFSNN